MCDGDKFTLIVDYNAHQVKRIIQANKAFKDIVIEEASLSHGN